MSLGHIINSWKYILVLPHLLFFYMMDKECIHNVREDLVEMNRRCNTHKSLAFYLVFHKPFRNLFYFRVGKAARFMRLLLRPYSTFWISENLQSFGGGAFVLNHPYSTIINAKSIGKNFTICQLTTIGNARHGRNDLIPSIGNNVSLGANVIIIGDVKIGNNVIIGAGSVVVKDVPDNCVVAGNPAKIVRYL